MNREFWRHWRERLAPHWPFFQSYLRNPVQSVKSIPNWEFIEFVVLLCTCAAASGALSGIVALKIGHFFVGLIFLPVTAVAATFIVAGIFYYIFMFFFKIAVPFKNLAIGVFICSLPLLMVNVLSELFPPINLLGVGVSALLMVICFSANFAVPQRPLMRIIVAFVSIYVIMWVFNSVQVANRQTKFHKQATPESLDILEKELQAD